MCLSFFLFGEIKNSKSLQTGNDFEFHLIPELKKKKKDIVLVSDGLPTGAVRKKICQV